MTTEFHSARVSGSRLKGQISRVQKSALAGGLMSAITGLVAVLNDQRQVLAANQALLEAIGISDPSQVVGLRPGEVLGCVHARETAAGCGTTEFCDTCGVAIAIARAFATNVSSEESCPLQVKRGGTLTDLFFHARCSPVAANGQRFYLLCLEEITQAQRSAALQRIFFQDINGLIASLSARPSARRIKTLALASWTTESYSLPVALDRQLALHKQMAGEGAFSPVIEETHSESILAELRNRFSVHPAASGKTIAIEPVSPDFTFATDSTVLLEVLSAMVANALEATRNGGQIRLSARQADDAVTFAVWNRGMIAPKIARRVFQQNFTTKGTFGRGLGAYYCKKLGEEMLGGQVGFKSSKSGTVFQITLHRADSSR